MNVEIEQIKQLLMTTGTPKDTQEKLRTEQDLIEYYEMKAVDAYEQEDGVESDGGSIEKNIRKVEKGMKKGLNDSREHDFEGFDDL